MGEGEVRMGWMDGWVGVWVAECMVHEMMNVSVLAVYMAGRTKWLGLVD